MNERNAESKSAVHVITISVLGVSGAESLKGSIGVGKSLICNRFIRGDHDHFKNEHSSILSQADFRGSPVINSDHWIYWGDCSFNREEASSCNVQIRLIEQTEFVDDETFEPFEASFGDYAKRATRIKVESAGKLMYICKEQLGLETEFQQSSLPDGKAHVDGFIYVYDISFVADRSFEMQSSFAAQILQNVLRTKKPVIVAASKADIADENGRKALHRLLSRKEFRSLSVNLVEVSSVLNVNITVLFSLLTAIITKGKVKPKCINFIEAYKLQKKSELEFRDRYIALLRDIMPIEQWPKLRFSWIKLLNIIGISRYEDYQKFVNIFGQSEAIGLYEKHVNEAKEYWMQKRLYAEIPRLDQVFNDLIGVDQVRHLSWAEAKELICNHPLYDEYFMPLGEFAIDLDPLSSQIEMNSKDSRLPGELLLTVEAEPAYNQFQLLIDNEYKRERIQEAFEETLAHCAQVTPGKPLREVELFLHGNPIYESLSSSEALYIYDRYQEALVKKAEKDFAELLLERVQLFIEIVLKRRYKARAIRPIIGLDDKEMSELRNCLIDDFRYRQLNRLFEMRDKMICSYVSFVSYPIVQNCPAGNRCIDNLLPGIFSSFQVPRRQIVDSGVVRTVNLILYGKEKFISRFMCAISKLLRGDIMDYAGTKVRIVCKSGKNEHFESSATQTLVYLIDSVNTLDEIKQNSSKVNNNESVSLVVLVVDPSHLDSIPLLRHQASTFAKNILGSFIAPVSDTLTKRRKPSENELSTFFTCDQISRVLQSVCQSQIDSRADLRFQFSLMCGDQFPPRCLLASLLSNATGFTYSSQSNMATVELPVASFKKTVCIDLRISAYHSWMVSNNSLPIHGHILAYSARRRASFAHAAAAARQLISSSHATGNSILFAAVADVTDFFNDAEANILLTEGNELADELNASFVSLSPEVTERLHVVTFIEFLERILSFYSSKQCHFIDFDLNSDYSSVGHKSAMTRACTFESFNTIHSDCTTLSNETSSSRNSSRRDNCETETMQPRGTNVFAPLPSSSTFDVNSHNTSRTYPSSEDYQMYPQSDKMSLIKSEYVEVADEYTTVKDAIGNGPARLESESLDCSQPNVTSQGRSDQKPHRGCIRDFSKNVIPFKHLSAKMGSPSWISPKNIDEKKRTEVAPPDCRSSGNFCISNTWYLPMPQLPKSLTDHLWNLPLPINPPVSAQGIQKLHSVSAESLIDAGLIDSLNYYGNSNSANSAISSKKYSKNRFVRKVTSFRFRKADLRAGNSEKDVQEAVESEIESIRGAETRSVPQSPKREHVAHSVRKREPPSSNEKVSNAFSWLPTRSPKRNTRNTSVDPSRNNGVVNPADTLESLAACSCDGIPLFVKKCVDYIEQEGGLSTEGLYRVPGNQAQVIELEKSFNADSNVDLHAMEMPVHAVATALKNFLSSLPDPLIPYNSHDAMVNCSDCGSTNSIAAMRNVINELPTANHQTLLYLSSHLLRVAQMSEVNSMDIRNLAKVWWPTLFRPNFDSFESMTVFVNKLEFATQLVILSATQ